MSEKSLEVKVSASESSGILQFEGSVTLPSLAKTKLATKDGVTKFDSLAALKNVARRAASNYGFTGVTYDDASAQKRVAAKRAASSSSSSSSYTG